MKKVISFGEALIDMLSSCVSSVSDNVEDTGNSEHFTKFPGGAPANVAAAIGKLGGRSYFAGKVGADMFGDFLKLSLEQMKVRTDYLLQTSAGKTALAFVSLDQNGERSFAFYRDGSADLLFEPQEFQDGWFDEPGILHFCSNTLTEASIREATQTGIRKARGAGFLISFDINLRQNLWPGTSDPFPVIWDFIQQADIIKLSAEELDFLCRNQDEMIVVSNILDAGATLVIVTDGNNPLRYFTAHTEGALQPPKVTMVDSTAAGDAFVGGLLYRLAELDTTVHGLKDLGCNIEHLESVLAFASACGAHAVTRAGAFTSLPDHAALDLP